MCTDGVDPGRPWLERQAAKWSLFAAELRRVAAKREGTLLRYLAPRLLAHARKMKSYDAYYSTTIEGYPGSQKGHLSLKRVQRNSVAAADILLKTLSIFTQSRVSVSPGSM